MYAYLCAGVVLGWKQSSKFLVIQETLTDFHGEKLKNQNGRLKKTEFFKTTNSQYLFAKRLEIGSWVDRINGCKGH